MKKTSEKALFIIRLVLGIAAIAFIITSMVTDKVTPYLAIGMSLTAIANIMNCSSKKFRNRLFKNYTEDNDDPAETVC